MNNFIFSINELFSSCLAQNNADSFYIGSYQRGYKWKSGSAYDQIPILITDLYEAFLKSESQGIYTTEYYLQYITLKKQLHDSGLEVIDGQQRLTSIVLMFTVLEKYFGEVNICKKDGNYLLTYARYSVSEENIFDVIIDHINIETVSNELEEQDKFYMLEASLQFQRFFTLLKEKGGGKFINFINFIKNDVKIIINQENEFTSAEEVFSNLNGNKVALTDTYLIKALLLTKATRLQTGIAYKKHFKEVIDQRSLMARTWDEINNWLADPKISLFFFGDELQGFSGLLQLAKPNQNTQELTGYHVIREYRNNFEQVAMKKANASYELFNSYAERVVDGQDAQSLLNDINHIYKRLKSWYEDTTMYNMIGFYVETHFIKNNSKTVELTIKLIKSLLELDNNELIAKLNHHIYSSIDLTYSSKNLDTLNYNEDYNKIKTILLALSVFPEGSDSYFSFYEYATKQWTLEHIFPQNPESSKHTIKLSDYVDDYDWLKKELKKYQEQVHSTNNALDEKTADDIIDTFQLMKKIESSESIESKELGFVFEQFEGLHNLGNMALLSGSVNSALNNGFFNTKRCVLLKHVNGGSFVPKHTMDVFSKMLDTPTEEKFDNSLITWSNTDAIAHLGWIKNRIEILKKEFSK